MRDDDARRFGHGDREAVELRCGHIAGDDPLKRFGEASQDLIRQADAHVCEPLLGALLGGDRLGQLGVTHGREHDRAAHARLVDDVLGHRRREHVPECADGFSDPLQPVDHAVHERLGGGRPLGILAPGPQGEATELRAQGRQNATLVPLDVLLGRQENGLLGLGASLKGERLDASAGRRSGSETALVRQRGSGGVVCVSFVGRPGCGRGGCASLLLCGVRELVRDQGVAGQGPGSKGPRGEEHVRADRDSPRALSLGYVGRGCVAVHTHVGRRRVEGAGERRGGG